MSDFTGKPETSLKSLRVIHNEVHKERWLSEPLNDHRVRKEAREMSPPSLITNDEEFDSVESVGGNPVRVTSSGLTTRPDGAVDSGEILDTSGDSGWMTRMWPNRATLHNVFRFKRFSFLALTLILINVGTLTFLFVPYHVFPRITASTASVTTKEGPVDALARIQKDLEGTQARLAAEIQEQKEIAANATNRIAFLEGQAIKVHFSECS